MKAYPSRRWLTYRRARAAIEDRHVHAELQYLAGPRAIPTPTEMPAVVCLVRDGEVYIEAFLAHYQALGCRHFALVDNGSSDGTLELLRRNPNVTLLQCKLPFDRYKRAIRRCVIRRVCRGGWCLGVDIDEFFDYPYSDALDLRGLLRYLAGKNQTAVVAQMLDLFPEKLTPIFGQADRDFRKHHRLYDTTAIERRPYGVLSNKLADPRLTMYFGGVRRTLFDFGPWLTKHPLFYCDDRTLPYLSDSHCVERANVTDVSAVLYHYKFAGDFFGRVQRAVKAKNYYRESREYRYYDAVIRDQNELAMKQPTSRVLQSARDLIDSNFLIASEDFIRFALGQRS